MKDQQIISELKAGNKELLGEIYLEYKPKFIAWIRKDYRCPEEEARELFQYALLAFYKNVQLGKLENLQSGIKTYIFSIGKNQYLSNKKKQNRFGFSILENVMDHSEEDREEKIQDERKINVIKNCLDEMGDPCKSLIQLTYFNKLSMDDICERLGYKNRETAKNAKYKCMERVRKMVLQRILTVQTND